MVSGKTPPVAVVMGSDSDLSVMESCVEQLRQFGIEPTVRILSAHRTPQAAAEFAEGAEARGIRVIVAAAGMAAHLAGALASRTLLPVIGVPLVAEPGLGGIDALLSTVQMPPGVPVATMALGKPGAKNAAILAVQILAIQDPDLRRKLADFRLKQEQTVRQKDASLSR
ncbi:MAG TPA: 5-(carboxyamino)imidazole ribonucleotide mutase [Sedimentisphaerales bacterium]|nr:5-(carboxyamino)imidazole ribonucleotide mutase [Sedimentisphaerales bacterium]HRS13266.1 5-(carboxyamino)imidazole ribonucleotide mutase [Sedimentisphaerales bacterium]HRV49875.1 5-(carboxyamino)imidazole ribonucleotide mutase [Sedimentisphaerales bacterium]